MGNTQQFDNQAKVYNPANPAIPYNHPLNTNSIFPCYRKNSLILGQKLEHGAAGEISKSHFLFKRILAHGQFGPVWLAEKYPSREEFVVKVMSKTLIYNRRCVDTVMNEQKLLSELMHPTIGNLRYSF